MSFFANLFGAHGKKLVSKLTDEIVALDPKTATAAQLKTMEESLDAVGKLLGSLRADATREQREADEAQARYDRQSAAAKLLNTQLEAETDPARKASLEKSLTGLLDATDKLKGELDREKQEAADAQALLKETEDQFNEKSEQLLLAKKQLESAARDMQRAQVQQERAEAQAENAARLAGLRDDEVGGLNAALNSMQRRADEARASADTARTKAAALSKKTAGAEDDPNVAAALAQVAGTTTASASLADRVKAL